MVSSIVLVYSRAGHLHVYKILVDPLLAPMASWRRAFRRPVDASRMIATVFVGLPPGKTWSLGLMTLWQAGLGYVQHRGWPGSSIKSGCLRAGEERPNPEMLSLVRVAVKSSLGSDLAGL